MPPGEMYPVMMTMVQGMYSSDPPEFVSYVDRIKAGEDPEELLMELYDVNYIGLEQRWRHFMAR